MPKDRWSTVAYRPDMDSAGAKATEWIRQGYKVRIRKSSSKSGAFAVQALNIPNTPYVKKAYR